MKFSGDLFIPARAMDCPALDDSARILFGRLVSCEEDMTLQELAEVTGDSLSTVRRRAKALESAGLARLEGSVVCIDGKECHMGTEPKERPDVEEVPIHDVKAFYYTVVSDKRYRTKREDKLLELLVDEYGEERTLLALKAAELDAISCGYAESLPEIAQRIPVGRVHVPAYDVTMEDFGEVLTFYRDAFSHTRVQGAARQERLYLLMERHGKAAMMDAIRAAALEWVEGSGNPFDYVLEALGVPMKYDWERRWDDGQGAKREGSTR